MSAQVADATTTRPLSWSSATIDQVENAGEAAATSAKAMTVLPHPVLIVNPVAPATRTGNRPVRQCAPWLGPRPGLRTARALSFFIIGRGTRQFHSPAPRPDRFGA